MTEINPILQEYATLREAGVGAKEALRRLRPNIEPLAKDVKNELVGAIRNYEAGSTPPAATVPRTTQQIPAVKPIRPIAPPSASDAESKPRIERANCWNCGKPNRVGEVICVHCGAVLSNTSTDASTKRLDKDDFQPEYYDVKSALQFHVRHNKKTITIRPQDSPHETIVGRSDSRGIVTPDVDLSEHGASHMGVSRMHMSLSFDKNNKRLIITDMGSVNGLHVNGQRLAVKEDRVLRHGDQLRLGDMVIDVNYKHDLDV